MTDASSVPPRRVSLSKNGDSAAGSARSRPPQQVLLACLAVAGSALAAVVAALLLHTGSVGSQVSVELHAKSSVKHPCTIAGGSGVKKWVYQGLCDSAAKSNAKAKKKDQISESKLLDKVRKQASQAETSVLISSLIFGAVLGLVAFAAYRGRYWARWGVLGVWFLATLTGTVYGISSLLAVGTADVPIGYKAPSFLAALFLLVAVVLTQLRPSVEYFALTRPAPRPGQPARRGLFAPRPPAGGAPARQRGAVKSPADAARPTRPTGASDAAAERARTKKRATTASVAKGAELARSRAKAASKSRRTDV